MTNRDHYPHRGDQVEAWIKNRRDSYRVNSTAWIHLDLLLDEYRLAADTGQTLGEEMEYEARAD